MKYKVKCLIPGTYYITFLKRYVGKHPEENAYRSIVWDTTNKQTNPNLPNRVYVI